MVKKLPNEIKHLYLYNKILSFYIILLAIVIIMGGVFIGAGGAGVMILFPLGIIYVLWYFLMMWGLNFRKNYSYWLNIFVHCLIVIVNIIRLFSIESDQLFGVKVSFITFSGIGVVISNVVFSLVLIGFSGYFVYVLFQKDVKKVF